MTVADGAATQCPRYPRVELLSGSSFDRRHAAASGPPPGSKTLHYETTTSEERLSGIGHGRGRTACKTVDSVVASRTDEPPRCRPRVPALYPDCAAELGAEVGFQPGLPAPSRVSPRAVDPELLIAGVVELEFLRRSRVRSRFRLLSAFLELLSGFSGRTDAPQSESESMR